MIDLKTEAREKDLANALGKNQKETMRIQLKVWDRSGISSKQHVEWDLTISYCLTMRTNTLTESYNKNLKYRKWF